MFYRVPENSTVMHAEKILKSFYALSLSEIEIKDAETVVGNFSADTNAAIFDENCGQVLKKNQSLFPEEFCDPKSEKTRSIRRR